MRLDKAYLLHLAAAALRAICCRRAAVMDFDLAIPPALPVLLRLGSIRCSSISPVVIFMVTTAHRWVSAGRDGPWRASLEGLAQLLL